MDRFCCAALLKGAAGKEGAGESAQKLGPFACFAEDLGLIFCTHIMWSTTTSNSNYKKSNSHFWPLWVLHLCAHTNP